MAQQTVVKLLDRGGDEPVIQAIHGFDEQQRAVQAVYVLLNMFALDGDLEVVVEVEPSDE